MKRLLAIAISAVLGGVLFSGCQKVHESGHVDSVCIYSAATEASAAAGSRTVTVFATCDWSVASNDAWLSVSPSEGQKGISEITYSWEANTTGAVRSGSLSLKAGSFTDTYPVNQAK